MQKVTERTKIHHITVLFDIMVMKKETEDNVCGSDKNGKAYETI